jgi:hypothetical protein
MQMRGARVGAGFCAGVLGLAMLGLGAARAIDEPKTVAVDKLPKDIRALHGCAKAPGEVEMASEKYAKSVVFFVSCPAPRGALTPFAVYVARDARGSGAKRVKFEVPAPDGSMTTLDVVPSAIPAREAYSKPEDPAPNQHVKNDVVWITGAWGPEDRPGICAVAAQWRLQGEKAELFLWEQAKDCPKNELPKYEATVDKKPPPLVGP